jgi:hypothetical protein
MACQGNAWHVKEKQGMACKARQDMSRQGMDFQGKEWQG